jgi:16S rRNA (cytidine1402-2'-O)-methyltransferase
MGLTLVPTPLGNLQDITIRALEVLRSCDLVAAEDTRVARRLLSAHNITGKALVRYDEHSSQSNIDSLVARAALQTVAVITDAGMPGISDPGTALVAAARASGVSIEVLPGPVAFVCAAVLSGFALAPLVFDGFFPRAAPVQRRVLALALQRSGATVWYESPHRIAATLAAIGREAADAQLFVVREFTKKFEQQLLGTAAEVLAALPTPPRGEFMVVLRGRAEGESEPASPSDDATIDGRIDELTAQGCSVAAIAKRLAQEGLGERAELYTRATQRREHRR